MLSFDQDQRPYMLNYDMLNTDRCKKSYHKMYYSCVYQDTYINIPMLICLASTENLGVICLLLKMLIGEEWGNASEKNYRYQSTGVLVVVPRHSRRRQT